jgi:trans-L-3-hydroxyproline dehydratase
MDVVEAIDNSKNAIKCVDMHTTGEPTRIVYSGFPRLEGTLLEQRETAMAKYDHLRKRMMLEPRGHFDMYGAILVSETELTKSGDAHMGTLFTHNGGFSTMCGHATIAMSRFLVDTHDMSIFPKRNELKLDKSTQTVQLNLHAPCGLVRVTVPATADGQKSDPSRPVSFLSTPAFAAAKGLEIPIPDEIRWPELGTRKSITIDLSYGGAFYALIEATELGFKSGLKNIDIDAISSVIKKLKPYLCTQPDVVAAIEHPEDKRLSFLYSIMVVDYSVGVISPEAAGAETGLCYFADSQIDRSPTGSCVTARMALAHSKGNRPLGQKWAYNSLVSNHFGTGAFCAEIVEITKVEGPAAPSKDAVIVKVEGKGYYTGTVNFILEEGDITDGFTMKSVSS